MKKVFLLTLGLVMGVSAFAQRATVNKEAKNQTVTVAKPSQARTIDDSAVEGMTFAMPQNMMTAGQRSLNDFEEFTSMTTNYDLQSNSALGNRIAVWPDGSASFVATWDHSGSTSYPDRGAGYNYYDGEDIGDEPEARQEPVKSGWPSIAACGNGEVLASHATGVNLYYRPTKGTGDWQLVFNWGADFGSPTWPRVVVSGPNNEYIHVVMCKQISVGDEYDNHIYYARITRNGNNVNDWVVSELVDFPGVDNTNDGDYRNQLSADDYVMAANGDNVAVMFSAYTTEVFYMISHDNGENWERQIIAPYPIADDNGNCVHAVDFADYPEGMTDTISTSDGSHSIAIDNAGTVHAAFGLFHWRVTDSEHYTYYPAGYYGIVYWNSNYTNEQGGHEILPYGQSSIDASHPEWSFNGLGWTLEPDRIEELAALNGNQANLHVFGYVDENGDGEISYDNVTGASWHYRSYGLATMPGVSVDNNGNVAVIYSVWSETRVCGTTSFSYRSAYVTCKDSQGTWFDDAINLCEDYIHSEDECYPTTISPIAYDNTFWAYYSADENQGLYLDISDTYPNSNLATLTENYIYAVKIVPQMPGYDGVTENEVINPMTTTRVYPNPATDMMTVEINASQSADAVISVYNIMGQNVMDMNVSVNTGVNSTRINTSELSSGVYFVTVSANGFSKTTKVVVK
jgi:hypothetical protein